jgi:uncharacterized protein YecE (DUF72 family)
MTGSTEVRVGTSGYVYRHWRKGVFYPVGLPARQELEYYAGRFSTVELNNPFYRLPTTETFQRWRDNTPAAFQFAVKASRYITHIKRLGNVGDELALFLDRADHLGPKLGPILFQLPPTQQLEPQRLDRFLDLLPKARRWVIEFRHPSWHTSEVYQRLSDRGVALCIPVGGSTHPDRVTTAPFTYIRMHRGQGPEGGFTDAELASWASQIRALRGAGKEIYVYFNNDWAGYAIRDAIRLRELLSSLSIGSARPRAFGGGAGPVPPDNPGK